MACTDPNQEPEEGNKRIASVPSHDTMAMTGHEKSAEYFTITIMHMRSFLMELNKSYHEVG